MEQAIPAETIEKKPRNIVVCCDGTGNKYSDENSNVVKLYTCLKENAGQVSYYHPGVGTMGDPRHTSWIMKTISVVGGLAFGMGFTDNLSDAYRFLMDNFADGDHIYLFGFSRGAYTVRALAGALRVYGLLCKGNEGHLPYLLSMYSEKSRKAYDDEGKDGNKKQIAPDRLSDGFRESFSRTVPIHFVGIWDTVSSVGGLYDPVKLLYDGQNSIVRTVRHAVSVDERRCFFQANLLGKPLTTPDTLVLDEHYRDPRQNIVQAWFAGVHSDVGGSYLQCESSPAMDAFKWILAAAEADGLDINDEKRKAILGLRSIPPVYPALEEMNQKADEGKCLHKSLDWRWAPLEAFPHKYFAENGTESKKKWRFMPWPHRREIPEGALIHPSLRKRLTNDDTYKPKNLKKDDVKDFSAKQFVSRDPSREFVVGSIGRSKILLHPNVVQQLEEEGFGLYCPVESAARSAVAPAIGIAAVILIGLASWCFRALR